MAHPIRSDGDNPVSRFETLRNYCGCGCLIAGLLPVALIGFRAGYDFTESTIGQLPLVILNSTKNAAGSAIVGASKFIAYDYVPAMVRYTTGQAKATGDVTSLVIGTAIAASAMFLGCLCFGTQKNKSDE
ncbi:MAG: hypothetical protein K940chlam1_00429 [Candidatus Anoxychlamydiales bacterium]|nr:hypothetical protein [Candidatus Anoxychlamydiales bacterium]NGX36283.1 hypothetical protein [Candidatus Anoxychlamydiales bacterium]